MRVNNQFNGVLYYVCCYYTQSYVHQGYWLPAIFFPCNTFASFIQGNHALKIFFKVILLFWDLGRNWRRFMLAVSKALGPIKQWYHYVLDSCWLLCHSQTLISIIKFLEWLIYKNIEFVLIHIFGTQNPSIN